MLTEDVQKVVVMIYHMSFQKKKTNKTIKINKIRKEQLENDK